MFCPFCRTLRSYRLKKYMDVLLETGKACTNWRNLQQRLNAMNIKHKFGRRSPCLWHVQQENPKISVFPYYWFSWFFFHQKASARTAPTSASTSTLHRTYGGNHCLIVVFISLKKSPSDQKTSCSHWYSHFCLSLSCIFYESYLWS